MNIDRPSRGNFTRLAFYLPVAFLITIGLANLGTALARDVSPAVKRACASDYFANCSMYAVGTPEVRKCMRRVGPNLSKGCISALKAAGEVTASDRRRYYKTARN
ncbi:MAG: hypothetical protein ACKOW3_05275 [Hyphomicrobium sp.]